MRSGTDGGRPTRVARALAALTVATGLAAAALLLAGPATAATDSAQLTLTGLSDNANPAGGSQLGIHPGDSVQLGSSAAPTTQAKTLAAQLGLSSLLSSLLSNVDFQVKADFSRLPGGAANTVLEEGATKTFRFTKVGTYYFTWQAEKVTTTTSLLGGKTTTTDLVTFDGNQAKKLGIELNADNTYIGAIVVATNPPKGGLSIQLPKVSLKPKVGNVTLPKVNLPGVNLPTVRVPVPDLTKSKSSTKTSSPPTSSSSGGTSNGGAGTVDNQLLPVPARVLGGGATGGGNGSGGGGGSGYLAGVNGVSPLGTGQATRLGSDSSDAANGSPADADQQSKGGSPSAQLPVVLAIIAVVALSLVGTVYARMFLLRRTGSS